MVVVVLCCVWCDCLLKFVWLVVVVSVVVICVLV